MAASHSVAVQQQEAQLLCACKTACVHVVLRQEKLGLTHCREVLITDAGDGDRGQADSLHRGCDH